LSTNFSRKRAKSADSIMRGSFSGRETLCASLADGADPSNHATEIFLTPTPNQDSAQSTSSICEYADRAEPQLQFDPPHWKTCCALENPPSSDRLAGGDDGGAAASPFLARLPLLFPILVLPSIVLEPRSCLVGCPRLVFLNCDTMVLPVRFPCCFLGGLPSAILTHGTLSGIQNLQLCNVAQLSHIAIV
jgi:hypothetical protein